MKLKTIKELAKDNCAGCYFDLNDNACTVATTCKGCIWVPDEDPRPEIEPAYMILGYKDIES